MLYRKESDDLLIVKLSAVEVEISGILHPEYFTPKEFSYVLASILAEPITRTNFSTNIYVGVEQGDTEEYPVILKVHKGARQPVDATNGTKENEVINFSTYDDAERITIPVEVFSVIDIPQIVDKVLRMFNSANPAWAVLKNGEVFYLIFEVDKSAYEQVLLFLFEFANKAKIARLSKNEFISILEHSVDETDFFLNLASEIYAK